MNNLPDPVCSGRYTEGVYGMTVWVPDRSGRQDASARRPVVDHGSRKVPFASRQGLRRSAGQFLLIVVGLVLVFILVSDLAGVTSGSQSIDRLSSRITRLENSNRRIQTEIELSTDWATINDTSIRKDLVSSRGVPTISLTAPDNLR